MARPARAKKNLLPWVDTNGLRPAAASTRVSQAVRPQPHYGATPFSDFLLPREATGPTSRHLASSNPPGSHPASSSLCRGRTCPARGNTGGRAPLRYSYPRFHAKAWRGHRARGLPASLNHLGLGRTKSCERSRARSPRGRRFLFPKPTCAAPQFG